MPGHPGHGDGLVFAVLGDQQPGGEVEGRHASPAEQGQHGDDEADQRDIGVQVAGYAAGHAGQHRVVSRPAAGHGEREWRDTRFATSLGILSAFLLGQSWRYRVTERTSFSLTKPMCC